MLGYTVLASESPFEAAEEGVFIRAFAKTNDKGAPVVTLVVTNIIIELFLITWPVSYTHLDVYKRQSFNRNILCFILHLWKVFCKIRNQRSISCAFTFAALQTYNRDSSSTDS